MGESFGVTPRKAKDFLRPLLDAQSVVIVGALPSGPNARLASKPVEYLQKYNYRGRIYPVNPKFDEIHGLKCYPSLSELPEVPDVVMVLRGAEYVAQGLIEAGEAGAKAAVVCSSGFAETGEAGRIAQNELAAIANRYGMALCGPNTNGVLNLRSGMVLGFHPLLDRPARLDAGSVSIVAQSGHVAGTLMARTSRDVDGFGYVISCGNEAVLQAADYLNALAEDEETQTVMLFIEAIRDGQKFLEACGALQDAGKRVVALKTGRTAAAAEIVVGHTGALVGSYEAFQAVAKEYGIMVPTTLEQLCAAIRVSKPRRARTTGIVEIAPSGGFCAIVADLADLRGVPFCPLDSATKQKLKDLVPLATPNNPFDLTGIAVDKPTVVRDILQTLYEGTHSEQFVFALGLVSPETGEAWSHACAEFVRETGVGFYIYAAAGREPNDGYSAFQARAGIEVFDELDPLIEALRMSRLPLTERKEVRGPDVGAQPLAVEPKLRANKDSVHLDEIGRRRALLAEWGLRYAPYQLATSQNDVVAAATQLGFPVAIKIATLEVAHKAAEGLVALDIGDEDSVRDAYERLSESYARLGVEGKVTAPLLFEVQKMLARDGVEIFVGGRVDETFGPMVSVGFGGRLVEIVADIASARAPLGIEAAEQLLLEVKSLRRAITSASDRRAVAKLVSSFSELLASVSGEVVEIELNPVVLSSSQLWLIDDLWNVR